MLLTGKPITAQDAFQAGLVSKLVQDKSELEEEIQSICDAIIAKPRGVVAMGKKFYQQQLEMPLSLALEHGGKVMVDNLEYRDAQEGIAAFIEKRKPNWCHTQEKFSTE